MVRSMGSLLRSHGAGPEPAWRAAAKASLRTAARLARRPWLLLPFLALPAISPFWTVGFPRSADGLLHLLRLILLDRYLAQGVFYARWLPDLTLGFGYPVFSYYGPGSYYIAEALHLLGLGYVQALLGAFTLLIIAAGLGMYLMALAIFGPRHRAAAMVAATAYMYAPYLLTNVFIRGAIAEVGAQALLPWIMWSTWRVLTAERPAPYVLPVALSLGGLIITHTINLLFVPPLWIAFVVTTWLVTGRRPAKLAWAVLAGAAAAGISCFFWVPLLLERGYLAATAYQVSAKYLPENVWTLKNFLDTSFLFNYTFAIPFRLGLAQLALALVGLVLARRRDGTWVFFLVAAAIAAAGISAWTLPLWLHSSILLIAQFPWRLLTIVSLSLALFSGGVVLSLRGPVTRLLVAGILIALVIFANTPRLGWMDGYPPDTGLNPLAAIAQFEDETGAVGTSSAAEFRPRWATSIRLATDPTTTADTVQVRVHEANDFGLTATTTGGSGGAFRFTTFYFPGWEVVLDGRTVLAAYPSTNLGLLTVDLPPGQHDLRLSWRGTPVQHVAGLVTLLTLAGLMLFYLPRPPERHLAFAPAVLLVCGVLASLTRPASQPVHTTAQPVGSPEVSFLAYRTEELADSQQVLLFPYWYVRRTPAAAFRTRWQLLDAKGMVVSQLESRPYFNALDGDNWPPGTLVDDAYALPLPPGTPAGVYRLTLQLNDLSKGAGLSGEWQAARVVGDVVLKRRSPPGLKPHIPLNGQFGPAIQLVGFDIKGAREATPPSAPPVVNAGDMVQYTLYWRALGPVQDNYHGFLHMVDNLGHPLVQQDTLLGGVFAAPRLWDVYHLYPDPYRLRIPVSAESGLYWPWAGLYEFKTQDRLAVTDTLTGNGGDHYQLPPVKVLGRQDARPQRKLPAHFDGLADLLGYDLALPPGGLHPGSQFGLTLYYRSSAPTANDYTRFVHFYDPELGMAAQNDGLPQGGHNPTWSWVAGEVVADHVELVIEGGARAGQYYLQMGFYDNKKGGLRLPAADARGRALPDAQVDLVTLEVSN
jgi:6-pyruvoyl-tetrahydropterin synthase related domain